MPTEPRYIQGIEDEWVDTTGEHLVVYFARKKVAMIEWGRDTVYVVSIDHNFSSLVVLDDKPIDDLPSKEVTKWPVLMNDEGRVLALGRTSDGVIFSACHPYLVA